MDGDAALGAGHDGVAGDADAPALDHDLPQRNQRDLAARLAIDGDAQALAVLAHIRAEFFDHKRFECLDPGHVFHLLSGRLPSPFPLMRAKAAARMIVAGASAGRILTDGEVFRWE